MQKVKNEDEIMQAKYLETVSKAKIETTDLLQKLSAS
jgi:hypothetical protein